MIASILAIGDEIVSGLVTDTNSAHIARALAEAGVEVASVLGVPDDVAAIRTALERAMSDADLVVTTGGLGPTADDLTTRVISETLDAPLSLHAPSLDRIRERFRERGLQMPENNRKQAMLPAGCEVLPNPEGTAPGFVCSVSSGVRARAVAALPGVPREMARMVDEGLVPWVRTHGGGGARATRIFSTFGLSESALDERLVGLVEPGGARLAFRASFPRIQARVTVTGGDPEALERRLDTIEARARALLGDHLYAIGDVGLEEVVGALLRRERLTLAVAESCTGGLIGHRITEAPGSSAYLLGGVVAYANSAKTALLGVDAETLTTHGAVSLEVAEAMAVGARSRLGADLGLATTGIAGPGGGTPEKPVGTVCIALAWNGGTWSRRYQLGDRGRGWIKAVTAETALDLLRRRLLGTLDR